MSKTVIWEAWWLHFGTLGDHLGDPGVPGDTPQDTMGPRSGFLSIFDGFGSPFGVAGGALWGSF